MRAADPVHNVELRVNQMGHDSVVFAFPYRAEIVDAVRAIPGRRFDWEAKEWWAPRADAVAPFVKGVLERHPSLSVSPDVQAWLARAVTGWIGRVSAGRLDGSGHFVLETIAGELEEPLAAAAAGARRAAVAAVHAGGRRGAAGDQGRAPGPARRCAARAACRWTSSPPRPRSRWPRATASRASSSTSTGTRRRSPPSSPCPPARRTAARSPSTPTCSSRSSTTCAPSASSPRRTRARSWTGCASSTTPRSSDVRRSRAFTGEPLEAEARLGGELRPFQRAGVAYVLHARRTFLADEQGLGKTVQALAALEADDAYPAVVVCPAGLKLNWQREIEHWLPHRSVAVVVGHLEDGAGGGHPHHQLRDRARAPRAAGAAQAEGAGARRVPLRQEPARQAHAGRAPARRGARCRTRCGWPSRARR